MKKKTIAFMIYGDINSNKNALTDEKYKELANAFIENGFKVTSVLYNDEIAEKLAVELLQFDAVLVWVNPIENGRDRTTLDSLLRNISSNGCFVATHPDIIMKIGTKDVLYKTRDMEWGSDTKLYISFEDFKLRFLESLKNFGIRVLKQYRGNGGNGVFKIVYHAVAQEAVITHAIAGGEKNVVPIHRLCDEFKPYFENNGILIDQEWNKNIYNGVIRCYLTGNRISGFGYQEINALYQAKDFTDDKYFTPSKRYYFTEYCGLFQDLRAKMENSWVPQLQDMFSINSDMMPVLWDADFFINDSSSADDVSKYTLCEINVSCVSPFPPSSINYIVKEVEGRVVNQDLVIRKN